MQRDTISTTQTASSVAGRFEAVGTIDRDFAQKLFPIAASDRRKHLDLFEGALDGGDFRDDDAFYETLAALIREGEIAPFAAYDNRMGARGKGHKKFLLRAAKHLQTTLGTSRPLSALDGEEMAARLRTPRDRAVAEFVHALTEASHPPTPREGGEATPPVPTDAGDDPDESLDGRAIAAEIRAELDEMAYPSVDHAETVLELAEALLVATRKERERLDRRERLGARRAALRSRLDALSASADALEVADGDALDTIEALLTTLEVASEARDDCEARMEAARVSLRRAMDEDEDEDESDRLLRAFRDAKREMVRAEEALADARRAFAARPGDDAVGPEAPESPADPEPLAAEPDPRPDAKAAPAETAPEAAASASEREARPEPEQEPEPKATRDIPPMPQTPPMAATPEPEVAPVAAVDALPYPVLLATYLAADEIVLAWHLARIAARNGRETGIPAAVLEAAAIGGAVTRPEDVADSRISALLAEAMEAVGRDEADEAATLVAFGGLLRAALFDPHHGARNHVRNLPRQGAMAEFAPLAEALGELGYDVSVSVDALAASAGHVRVPRLPRILATMREWLDGARMRKTAHQPTYFILHRELSETGEVGMLFESALAGEAGSAAGIEEFVRRYDNNRTAQEAFVRESESRANRPRRDRIDGMALEWFCRYLQEACNQLRAWLDASGEATDMNEGRRAAIQAQIGGVRKAIATVREQGVDAKGREGGTLADEARRFVRRRIDDLEVVINGQAPDRTGLLRIDALLERDRLRLPGGAQDWTQGIATLAEERARADERTLAALGVPARVSPTLRQAFDDRCAELACTAARAILDILDADGLDEAERARMVQELDEKRARCQHEARLRVKPLRHKLSSLINLEAERSEEVTEAVERMSSIDDALGGADGPAAIPIAPGEQRVTDLPPDFPQLQDALDRTEAFHDALSSHIRESQRKALEELRGDAAVGSAVTAYLERLDTMDPVTIDADIAQFRDGQPVSAGASEAPDPFEAFFPGFVERVDRLKVTRGAMHVSIQQGTPFAGNSVPAFGDRAAKGAKQLLEAWAAAEKAMRKQPRNLRESARTIFETIGFGSVRLDGGHQDLMHQKMYGLRLSCDVPRGMRWFLPPSFGSLAQGRYPVIATRDVSRDQLLARLGDIGRDRPCIVLYFGQIDREERQRIGRMLRREGQLALILDETLLFYMVLNWEDRFQTFFSCTTPFSWLQPYTTSAGQVPPEMFFGRRAEIEQVTELSSRGCLIYGGRQLGKSALLHHIRAKQHRPEDGQLALYFDIKPIGGSAEPPELIWRELGRALTEAGVACAGPDRASVEEGIRAWLAERPERRILAMFDEADNFLSCEHEKGNGNLIPLKALMEETNRRFKVVFAGLHNVRRMAQAPNSPLPHLGDPLCIGPMNLTPRNREELYRLSVEPLRAAGFAYADPTLIRAMLARMNNYPSLVQIFGHHMVEALGREPAKSSDGPYWQLNHDTLFESDAADEITRQIGERFDLTLKLDPRYELIAKSVALMRFDDDNRGGGAAYGSKTLEEIEDYIGDIWPPALPRLSRLDLRELLNEMVDLGVLTCFDKERFGLRTAHIAQLLGTVEQLNEAIAERLDTEGEVAYDAGAYHPSLRQAGQPSLRSPLPDRMLERVFRDGEEPLRIVLADPAITGERTAERLALTAPLWNLRARRAKADERHLGPLLRDADGPEIVILEEPWLPALARKIAAESRVVAGEVRVIWIPTGARGEDVARIEHEARSLGALIVRTRPWNDTMLRYWLRDNGLMIDDLETRKALMRASGGAPVRLEAMIDELDALTVLSVRERVARLEGWARANPLPARAANLTPAQDEALRTVCVEGARTLEDIRILHPEASPETLRALIDRDLLSGGRHDLTDLRPTPLGVLATATAAGG